MFAAISDSRNLLIALLVWILAGLGVALIDLALAGGETPVTVVPIARPLDRFVPGIADRACPDTSRPC